MATTGEHLFTQASTTSESPWLDEPWVTPAEALTENNVYANVTAATFDATDQTQVLRTFDADASLAAALPTDLVSIDGVIVRINAFSDSLTLVVFDLVQLLDEAGAKGGTNLGANTALGTDTTVYHQFGDATQLWGRALTRDWLIDPQFGVAIGVLANTNNSQCFVDVVTIEVFYTEQPPPPAATPETMVPIVSVTTVA